MKNHLLPLAVLVAIAGCVSWSDMRAQNAYLQGHLDKAEQLNDSALSSDPNDLQAKKLGAKIMIDGQEVKGMGRLSIFEDPTGALLGLWEPKE